MRCLVRWLKQFRYQTVKKSKQCYTDFQFIFVQGHASIAVVSCLLQHFANSYSESKNRDPYQRFDTTFFKSYSCPTDALHHRRSLLPKPKVSNAPSTYRYIPFIATFLGNRGDFSSAFFMKFPKSPAFLSRGNPEGVSSERVHCPRGTCAYEGQMTCEMRHILRRRGA